MPIVQRELFGGAITCEVPSEFDDISQFRQVPDNQEVFALANENDPTLPGPSLIIELLEYQPDASDQDAASYYFTDLARANGIAVTDSSSLSSHTSFVAQRLGDNDNTNTVPTSTFPQLSAFSSGIGMQYVTPGRVSTDTTMVVGGSGGSGSTNIVSSNRQHVATTATTTTTSVPSVWTKVEIGVLRLRQVQTDLLVTLTVPIMVSSTTTSPTTTVENMHNNDIMQGGFSETFRRAVTTLSIRDWGLFG